MCEMSCKKSYMGCLYMRYPHISYIMYSPPVSPRWGSADVVCTCDVQRCPVLYLYLNIWSLCCRWSLVGEEAWEVRDRRPGQRAPVPGRTLSRGPRGARRSGRGRHGSTIAAGRTPRRLLTEMLLTKKCTEIGIQVSGGWVSIILSNGSKIKNMYCINRR